MQHRDNEATAGAEQGSFPPVTVYTSNDCRWCPVVKQYLVDKGVPYTERNVEEDEAAAMEAFRLAGRRQTPVIAVGPGVVVGFQRRELDELLGLAPGV